MNHFYRPLHLYIGDYSGDEIRSGIYFVHACTYL